MAMTVQRRYNDDYAPKLPPIDMGYRGVAKVHSLDNIGYKPAGGNNRIYNQKVQWNAHSKVGSLDDRHLHYSKRPHSDERFTKKKVPFNSAYEEWLNYSRTMNGWEYIERNDDRTFALIKNKQFMPKPKVDSFGNIQHQPKKGDVKIINQTTDWKANAKVGSLDNATHRPGGGDVHIHSEKLVYNAAPKVGSRDNINHQPHKGNVTIQSKKLQWRGEPKVDDKSAYTPRPSEVKIMSEKCNWKGSPRIDSLSNKDHKPAKNPVHIMDERLAWNAEARVGSLDNYNHSPGGGNKHIPQERLQWNAKSKVASRDNIHHQPGGGHTQITNEHTHWKASPKVGSLELVKHQPGGGNIKIVHDPQRFVATPRVDASNTSYQPGGGHVDIVDNRQDWNSSAAPRVPTWDNINHQAGGGDFKIPMKLWPGTPFETLPNISRETGRWSKNTSPRGRSLNTSRSSGVIRN